MTHFLAYGLPLTIILLAVPMVLGQVPPNRLYGFRTPKTLSSPEIWYPANRMSGWYMATAGILALCFNLMLWWLYPDWPDRRLRFWMANAAAGAVLLALVASLLYVRRL